MTDEETIALYRRVKDKALSLLVRREHSRYELAQKLRSKTDGDVDIIEYVLDELAKENAQSDQRFAEHLCRYRVSSGKGPVKISHELRQNRIDDSIIDTVMLEFEGQWRDMAEDVRIRKFGPEAPGDFKEWARQAKFLQQRGFSNDHIGHYTD